MSDKPAPYTLCSTPAADGYFAMGGSVRTELNGFHALVPLAQWVPNRMSKECRYDKRFTDPRCPENCPRRNLPTT